MVKDLIRKLQKLTVEAVPFDPSSLGDEVATRTQWTPAKGGGASFQTHRLVEIDLHRTEFRATPGMTLFAGGFMVMGLAAMAIMTMANRGDLGTAIIASVVGLLFAGIGGGMLYFGAAPIVFDKRRGEFWKGRVAPYGIRGSAGSRPALPRSEPPTAVPCRNRRCPRTTPPARASRRRVRRRRW